MQETFVKAFDGLGSLRDRERVRPWLLQIARRVCIDHHRRKTPAGSLPEDVPARSESHDPRIDRLHAALGKLPAEYRETISLYYLDGRDCAGVAATLGISPGAVRTRLLRGRIMLYDLLAEDKT
jgi:RNA polymerase sigma-70 factor (ECF subfamily)